MGRALARLGIQVTSNPKSRERSSGPGDGAIFLNYTPSGEELWHVTGLMTLKSEWEEAGRPGDFNIYENARMTEMFDEMDSLSSAQAVPCQPCSPASMRFRRRTSRPASAFFIATQNSGFDLRQRLMQSQEMSSSAAASSSVSPVAM